MGAICGRALCRSEGKVVIFAARATKAKRLHPRKPVKKRPEVAVAGAFEGSEPLKFGPYSVELKMVLPITKPHAELQ